MSGNNKIFRVKRGYLMVSIFGYILVVPFLLIAALAPNPDLWGWVFFGAFASFFGLLSSAGVLFAFKAKVVISGSNLQYFGVWRSLVLDLNKIDQVYLSLGNIVIDTGEPKKTVIPDVFENNLTLVAILSEKATQRRR